MNHASELQQLKNFLSMLFVAVSRSYDDGVAICCVLPVLWMTSFSYNGPNGSVSRVTLPQQLAALLCIRRGIAQAPLVRFVVDDVWIQYCHYTCTICHVEGDLTHITKYMYGYKV